MKIDPRVPHEPLAGTPSREEINQRRLSHYIAALKRDQNREGAIVLALITALGGAFFWWCYSYYSGWAAPYLALLIGGATGLAVRLSGKGVEKRFGIYALMATLGGICLGNTLVLIQTQLLDRGYAIADFISGFQENICLVGNGHEYWIVQIFFHLAALVVAYFISFRNLSLSEIEFIVE